MSKQARKLMWFTLPRGATIPISVPAPSEVLRYWRMVKLAPGEQFIGWIRSTQLFATFVHYLTKDKTYAPCLAEAAGVCPMCEHCPKRYFAALAVYANTPSREACMLGLPRMAVRGLPELEALTGADLAGRPILAKRGPFRKSRVEARFPDTFQRLELPEEKWVRPSELLAQLLLLWGVRYRQEGELAQHARPADLAGGLYDNGESAATIPMPTPASSATPPSKRGE